MIPLATTILALSIFDPHPEDRVILHGFAWGIIACALYDVFRLDTVYMLGWWADFIPTMGTWIVGDGSSKAARAWVGYLWRYLGDGGGIVHAELKIGPASFMLSEERPEMNALSPQTVGGTSTTVSPCQVTTRRSPSVTTSRPTSACFATTSRRS